MNYNKMSVRDADLNGKKVLLRCDFNVPQDKETGAITSDKRIVAALPTIQYLLDNGAAVIACSHLGKPKGTWKESLTLAPVAVRLAQLLGKDVIFAKDIIGEDAKAKAAALPSEYTWGKKIPDSRTNSPAPELMPIIPGEARGLERASCRRSPATDRPLPQSRQAAVRGIRI